MSVTVVDHTIEVKAAVGQALLKAAEMIGGSAEDHAKDYVPVKTGVLQNSIGHAVEADENQVSIAVGTNTEYAAPVELGHHQKPGRYVPAIGKRLKADWVAPRPFIAPAIQNHTDEYEEIIQAVLGGL